MLFAPLHLLLLPLLPSSGSLGPTPCATTGVAFTGTPYTSVFQHRWAGVVVDVFTADGQKAWTVEDGARIRATTIGDFSPATSTFQTTPLEVKDMLRRVFFLPTGNRGWAVGEGGWVLATVNGGATWFTQWRENDPNVDGGKAILFDVHFLDTSNGWLVGLHQLKYTTNGGSSWSNATLYEADGTTQIDPCAIELYALDFLQSGSDYVGLATAEPGKILRTTNTAADGFGTKWTVVHDTCSGGGLLPACGSPCSGGLAFEPWDVEFVPGTDLAHAEAIVIGGIGHQCGYVLVGTTMSAASPVASWQQEFHECFNVSGCTPTGGPPCNSDASGRHTSFATLYGVTVNQDRSAVAVGYGGQHVWRDTNPAAPLGPDPTWRDRSQQAVPFEQGHPTQPMLGAGGDGSGDGFVVGYFNSIRAVSNGGECYTDQTRSLQFRLRDVDASSASVAWKVGQFSRVAKTTNGGLSWTPQTVSPADLTAPGLWALAFDGAHASGVAVGNAPSATDPVTILATTNGGADGWPAVAAGAFPSQASGKVLFEADFDGTSEFWAVGSNSLVLRSTSPSTAWTFDSPESPASTVKWHGVSFTAPGRGFVCGESGGRGKVWRYDSSQSTPWRNVTPSGLGLIVLMDVAADGDHAYAVGLKRLGGVESGVVLEWKLVGSTMQFAEVTSSVVQLPYCMLDGELEDGVSHTYSNGGHDGAILNDVEIVHGSDEVFVGGDCGRMLHKVSGTWSEIKSETSLHIQGMSFPSASAGFALGWGRGGSVVVAYAP